MDSDFGIFGFLSLVSKCTEVVWKPPNPTFLAQVAREGMSYPRNLEIKCKSMQ